MYQAEYHERVQPNSEAQREVKEAFTRKGKFAAQWWNANNPSAENAKGTEAYQVVMKAYKAQSRVGNPYCFLRDLVTNDLKVMLSDKDITGGIVPGGGGSGSDPVTVPRFPLLRVHRQQMAVLPLSIPIRAATPPLPSLSLRNGDSRPWSGRAVVREG